MNSAQDQSSNPIPPVNQPLVPAQDISNPVASPVSQSPNQAPKIINQGIPLHHEVIGTPIETTSPKVAPETVENLLQTTSPAPATYLPAESPILSGAKAGNPPLTPSPPPPSSPSTPSQNPPPPPAGQIPDGNLSGGSPPSPPPPPPDETSSPPPVVVPAGNYGSKFPHMFVTILIAVVMLGFSGSFLYLQIMKSKSRPTNVKPVITPPSTVTVIPTITIVVNPFATPSGELENPFAIPSGEVENPFGQTQNPFDQFATPSGSAPYTNPFSQ